jgi:hypothetical protein
MISKRGQAAGAAVLLALIAGLLVMFVILLPPAERAELLGEDSTGTSSGTGVSGDLDDGVVEKVLLSESPGRIDFLAQREIEHPLPVVNVYTRTESRVLAEKNLVSGKRGVFTDERAQFNFAIGDIDHTDNVVFTFRVRELVGDLEIKLNGEEIYLDTPSGSVLPIILPKNMLSSQNTLEFFVSSPGVVFWNTNSFTLENLQIVADVTNVEAQSSRNIFLISDTERKNMEKVKLKFQPECRYGDVGKLSVWINGQTIYSAVPDCDVVMIPIEFSMDILQAGENEIIFNTQSGTYLLSHVIIESELKELDFPTYFFDLSNEEFEDVENGLRKVKLDMDFVDVVSNKRGELHYNGVRRHFDTNEAEFVLDLSEDVVRGTNSVKIKPRKTIEVRSLRVELVK